MTPQPKLQTMPRQSSDSRKFGFLAVGILLGLLVYLLASGFGASREIAFALSTATVLGSLALALLRPGPARPVLSEAQRRQRTRSIAIAAMLVAFCAMFYAASIIRIGDGLKNRAATKAQEQAAPQGAAPQGAANAPKQ
jgi:hypothetical protein